LLCELGEVLGHVSALGELVDADGEDVRQLLAAEEDRQVLVRGRAEHLEGAKKLHENGFTS